MTGWSVFRRELKALARLPQTYGIAAAYLVISGIFFVNILISSELPDLAQYYSNIASTMLVLVPVVAMRSFAEERRSGALDMTLTWPVSRAGLALGKFAANTLFVWLLTSVAWLYYWLVGRVAAIQGGRTAGGYIGLLLMAAAFSALALAVSARASSPTAAAFLGFGLLLFLWVLEYAPGFIGDSLKSLGPAAHFESFPRGAVYWADAGYFAVLTTVGLGLTVAALSRERPGPAFGSVLRRGLAVGLTVLVWLAGSGLARSVDGRIDLTATKQNTITPATRSVLHQVHGPIHLAGYMEPISPDATKLKDLVRQYRAAGASVDLDVLDPDVQPARARAAGVNVYGQVAVEMGGRREVVDSADQVSLTSAIHRLSATTPPRACFTIGHGERSITDKARDGASDVANALKSLYFDVTPLALALPGADAELHRCTVVVMVGPRVPLLEAEATMLRDWTRDDGRLAVLADSDSPRDQLNALLAPWGMALGRGVVSDLSALAGDPASVVADDFPSKSPATNRLRETNLPVVLSSTVPVEPSSVTGGGDAGGSFTGLVRSSPKSWADPPAGQGARLTGPFVLAGLADDGRVVGEGGDQAVARTRVALVGSADVASNRVFNLLGNREFVTSLVQWVARTEDVISAGRAPNGFYKLVLTTGQKDRLVREGIVYPAALVLLPLPGFLLRLKRG